MDAETMLVSLLKNLIGNNIDEARVSVCYNNAVSAVKEYINRDSINVIEDYPYQVAKLAYFYYKSFNDVHVVSKSQGGRSITFSKDIPDEIKRSLPRYAKPF